MKKKDYTQAVISNSVNYSSLIWIMSLLARQKPSFHSFRPSVTAVQKVTTVQNGNVVSLAFNTCLLRRSK